MFKNIRRLKALNDEVKKEDAPQEKSICINVFCDNTENAISHFCDKDAPIINSEFADYLENKVEQIPLEDDVHIKVNGDADKDVLKAAIKNYYKNKLTSAKREFKKNGVLSAIFTLIAVLTLAAAVLLHTFLEDRFVLQEIVDIIGWVFMWEAVDLFFLERGALRIKQIRYLNFIRAEIE